MADWLPPELEGRDLQVVGVVAGLRPSASAACGSSSTSNPPSRSCRRGSSCPGIAAAVRRPAGAPRRHGSSRRALALHGAAAPAARHVNPHGFDYQAWLLERGIGANRLRPLARRAAKARRAQQLHGLDRESREAVRDRFQSALGATPAAGILAALAVGDQRAISGEEWQLFNRTGVTHLMSISACT